MSLIKFLIFDSILVILAIPLIFFFQSNKYKPGTFTIDTKLDNYKKQSISTPTLKTLLDLEASARKNGSGVIFESLIGSWNFEYVCKQGSDSEDSISSFFLRIFSACLELSKLKANKSTSEFEIINSIQFGLLKLKFLGFGMLKGSQPFLSFFFERIELKVGDNLLFSKALEIPEEKSRPFFSLIGIEKKSGRWLAARGRGGGLALWMKKEE